MHIIRQYFDLVFWVCRPLLVRVMDRIVSDAFAGPIGKNKEPDILLRILRGMVERRTRIAIATMWLINVRIAFVHQTPKVLFAGGRPVEMGDALFIYDFPWNKHASLLQAKQRGQKLSPDQDRLYRNWPPFSFVAKTFAKKLWVLFPARPRTQAGQTLILDRPANASVGNVFDQNEERFSSWFALSIRRMTGEPVLGEWQNCLREIVGYLRVQPRGKKYISGQRRTAKLSNGMILRFVPDQPEPSYDFGRDAWAELNELEQPGFWVVIVEPNLPGMSNLRMS